MKDGDTDTTKEDDPSTVSQTPYTRRKPACHTQYIHILYDAMPRRCELLQWLYTRRDAALFIHSSGGAYTHKDARNRSMSPAVAPYTMHFIQRRPKHMKGGRGLQIYNTALHERATASGLFAPTHWFF